MDERLLLLPLGLHKTDHVAQLRFGGHALLEVIDVAALHAALVGRGVQDGILLGGRDPPSGQAQADAAHIPNTAQQCQFICHGRVALETQHRVVSAAEGKVVGIEFCCRGRDAVQKIPRTLDRLRQLLFGFLFSHVHTPLRRNREIPPWSDPAGSRSPAGA